MSYNGIAERIKKEEGYSATVYLDSNGNPSGGYGCHLRPGLKLPHHIWLSIFDFQYRQTIDEYESLKLNLDSARKGVIVDMIFHMGFHRFKGFKRMLAALSVDDYETAAGELKDSKYFRDFPARAGRNYKMMKDGE